MPSRSSRSKSNKKSRPPSYYTERTKSERIGPFEPLDLIQEERRKDSVGLVERVQGVEDIVFGAVGELGHAMIGNTKGARRSAELFKDGVDTLLGRQRSKKKATTDQLSHRSADISLLRDTYFEGYDAGIHAGLSRAEAEAGWYDPPRRLVDRSRFLTEDPFDNAKALEQGPRSGLTR